MRSKRVIKQGLRSVLPVMLACILCLSMMPAVSFAQPDQPAEQQAAQTEALTQEAAQTPSVLPASEGEEAQASSDAALSPDAAESSQAPIAQQADAQENSEPSSAAEEPVVPESDAGYSEDDQGNKGIDVNGNATLSVDAAAQALSDQAGLDDTNASDAAVALFAEEGGISPQSDLPTGADGSNVDSMTAKWITPDTVDNGDADLLYLKPAADNDQSVRMQINYALSGEHNYKPGDIQIKVPASMFTDRDGNPIGTMTIPYPEAPAASADFNWQLIDGTYVLTNTKPMSAATKGFIQFSISDLTPHQIVDMKESNPFNGTIEVLTHKGNLIGATSNDITAQIDTVAEVTHASKSARSSSIVSASMIPEDKRIEGEEEYVVVDWYMNAYVEANQPYTLSLTDTKADEYNGFILDATSADGQSTDMDVFDGYREGDSVYSHVRVAYPASQFDPYENTYVFKNDVEYTLTEKDLALGDDPQLVTTAQASAHTSWHLRKAVFREPIGHFNVFKNGNDNVDFSIGKATHTDGDSYSYCDIWSKYHPSGSTYRNGYYGVYPAALNALRRGENVDLSYTVDTVGYILPWTLEEGADYRVLDNYGKKPVTMTTVDTGLSVNGTALEVGKDYSFKAIEFPLLPYICKALAINLKPDGSIEFLYAQDGTVDYQYDADKSHIPPITLEIQRNGAWEKWATADWTSGSLVVTLADGSTQTDMSVALPEGTTNFRTVVTATNAEVQYFVRPIVTLTPNGVMKGLIEASFEGANNPCIYIDNGTNMKATQDNGSSTIVNISKMGSDKLYGYTTDTKALASKSSTYTQNDIDYDKRIITLHYNATVSEQSFISDRTTYESAVAEGEILTEKSGTWYDLLPKGVTPDLSTVKLRTGDIIDDIYTIENYKGSGRTMLVVEATLQPQVSTYQDGDLTYYKDALHISFDAIYGFDSLVDFGSQLHNVISFESGNDVIGTIEGYQGEPDNPGGGQNVGTRAAFEDDVEKALMTDLDPTRDTPSFLYAGEYTSVDILAAGRTSLTKDVSVNNDGYWSDGTYGDDRTVYESGQYAYRLRMMSDDSTISKNLIMYDSLENFYAADGNDPVDIGAPRWQGSLVGVDVSQLEDQGCAPVVYYSTVENLNLQKDDGISPSDATDLSDTTIWSPTPPTDLSTVTAIAVDATKRADGTDFELEPLTSAVVTINMKAPQGEEGDKYVTQNAHAYNNAFLSATSIDKSTGSSDDNFVRKDYTKVGIEEFKLTVNKVWEDDENRDNARPADVTLHLYADDVDTGKTITLNEDNAWMDEFKYMPYSHDDGSKIRYSIREEEVPGYKPSIAIDGLNYTITNIHAPERISISGTKTWEGDVPDMRPESVKINLLANGEFARSQTIYPDAKGEWHYSFDNLFKYREGHEIVYTVEEEHPGSYQPVIDGYDITNVYHPFGNLTVGKTVTEASPVVPDKEFTFTFVFKKGEEVLFDEYPYTTSDGRTGTVATDGSVTLKDGQTVTVTEIPEGASYTVTEQQEPGYTNTDKTGDAGIIVPNETQQAQFVNEYAAATRVNLKVKKVLQGKEMGYMQFRFKVLDEDGNLVSTAMNGRPDTVNKEEGTDTVISSENSTQFGAIHYTQDDHDKTFTYTVVEVDSGANGITYDTTVYKATVKPVDNGDGTMSATITYSDEAGNAVDIPTFDNSYKAKGTVTPKVYKQLHGRDLADGEFSFELGRVTVDGTSSVFAPIQTKTNDAAGTVTFDEIEYNQADVGKTYLYAVHEKSGTDDTVEYDGHYELFAVTITDNGDGTLSAAMTATDLSCPCFICNGSDADCPACGGTGTIESSDDPYIFKNSLHNGGLDITKHITGDTTGADPNQTFTFRVELSNPNGDPVDIDMTKVSIELLNKAQELLAQAVKAQGATAQTGEMASEAQLEVDSGGISALQKSTRGILTALPGDFDAKTTAEEGSIMPMSLVEGTSGECTWTLDDAGTLTIKPTNGVSGTMASGQFSTQMGGDYTVTSLVIEEGVIAPSDCSFLFKGFSDLTTADVSNLDTSNVTKMLGMFSSCLNLGSIDVSNFDTSDVTDMAGMFGSCSSLTSLDVSGWDTSKVTRMADMFDSCRSLTSLDISSLDTSNVSDFSQLFLNCESLTSLNVSNINTSKATDMTHMFNGCKLLSSLDLSSFDTSNVTKMTSMFFNCSALTSLDLSSFNTSKVTSMYRMFRDCNSLASLDLSSFDTSNVTSMTEMFGWDRRLQVLNLGPKFSFKGNGITDVAKQALLPDLYFSAASAYTGKWVIADKSKPAVTQVQLRDNYPNEAGDYPAGTYVWETKSEVTITFDANQGAGSMPNQTSPSSEAFTLNTNSFTRFGYNFTGWNTKADGTGTAYAPGATIAANTFDAGAAITLYAQWEEASIITKIEDGVYEVTLPGDSVMHLSDSLPAGTTYRVYEQTPDGWVLVSSSDTTGTIKPDETANAQFTNRYQPGAASVQLHATKTLDGAYATAADGFSFELVENGAVLQTKTVADGGVVLFDPITYTIAGTHTYTIREVAGADTSINYDTHSETVTVTAIDDGAGNMTTTTEYDDDGAAFANTTNPGSLTLTKEVVGASDATADAQFNFTVTFNKNGVVTTQDVTLKAGESKTFDSLAPGTTYSIVETGLPDGWVQTGTVGTDGTIVSGEESSATITNTYAASGTAQIGVYKSFEGGQLTAGQFTFVLYDADGATQLGAVANGEVDTREQIADADGNPVDNPNVGQAPIAFDALSFTAPGTYTYYVAEQIPTTPDPGVVYDTSKKKVTVTVTDNGDSTLSSAVAFENNDNVFTNRVSQTGEIRVEKQVVNQTQAAADADTAFTFTMQLKDQAGQSIEGTFPATIETPGKTEGEESSTQEVEISDGSTFELHAGANLVATGLPYGAAYTVIESDASQDGWSQTGVVGQSGTIGEEQAQVQFENTYAATGQAVVQATKKYNDVLSDGQFSFQLADETGTVLQTVSNKADGSVEFHPIEYSDADNGKTFTYTVSEVEGNAQQAEFDKKSFTVTVTPTDDGHGAMTCEVAYSNSDGVIEGVQFENTRLAQLTKTGGPGVVLGLFGLALIAVGLVSFRRRKQAKRS